MKIQKSLFKNNELTSEVDIKDDSNLAILVFGDEEGVLNFLEEKYPLSKRIGCSSSGQIEDNHLREETLCVFLQFEKTEIKLESLQDINYANSYEYGQDLMTKLNSKKNLKGVILFSEGLDVNGAKVAEGMASINKKVKVAGGSAGDNLEFKETYVYANNKKFLNGLVGLGLYGDSIELELGSKSGVEPLGVEKKITEANNNVLYSLDGEKALDVYRKWFKHKTLEELSQTLLECPVEISSNFQKEEGLLRTPIAFNEEDGSITYTGEIPQEKSLRMMRADIEGMIEASEDIASETWEKIPNQVRKEKPVLSLLVSCAGRKAVLKEDIEDEFFNSNKLKENDQSFQVGFYSFGEYNRVNEEKGVEFLNQTMTVACIYEK